MDFELSEELIAVRDLAREFAEKEIAPSAAKDDREKNFRGDLVKKMGELGFYGTMIPDLYGGNGLGFLAMVLITEEIARVHSAMRVAINMQIGPAITILQFGTEEQRRRLIPPLISGEKIGCFAITEADAGSDVAGMRTVAKRDGDRYVLNGNKIFITNAPITRGGLVYAYTDRSQKHRGMSAFYADWDQPGLSRKPIETLGALCSPIGELTFENFPIPATNRLGNEGDGFKICMWQLNQTRLNCAAGALGVARAAKETAVSYCNQRVQFGQKIGEFQMNQDLIAQMIAHEEAARLLVYRAAWLADQQRPNNLETSIGKYAAAEAANFAADAAMKILGAYGYSTEFPVERYYRDAKSYQIVEGSSNVQKMIIAQDALGYRKANR
ncbi:MAG TPA: acyl-CoA dehydrogenase family protein [Candidatus Binatia bacterium]|jgi:glutaryl-CoA dehydrogenase (non-decarboxylating)|nr:acyl-CoA dehydrogenase family protein [Candidatus Binatia bacterium]